MLRFPLPFSCAGSGPALTQTIEVCWRLKTAVIAPRMVSPTQASEMGQLTTHILDTAQGTPARGVVIKLFRVRGDTLLALTEAVTNDDGRVDEPLLAGEAFSAGTYQLEFAAGSYFAACNLPAGPQFLGDVVIRFVVARADQHYHVPLLLSPYGYSTYRGS